MGIAIPRGEFARTTEEAVAIFRKLGGRVALKAQVPIGGRGKAGGIAVVSDEAAAEKEAARILAMSIRGYPVQGLWCEKALDIDTELYLGLTVDRDRRRLVIIFSAAGGVEIEQTAVEMPEKIAKMWPDPLMGPLPFEVRRIVLAGIKASPEVAPHTQMLLREVVALAGQLYHLALRLDAVTCEINPLVIQKDGTMVAGDAKLEIDENAEFRHHDLVRRYSNASENAASGDDPFEVEAKKRGLTYVHLPGGNIGCIANGAGLAMNTLDLVKKMGGEPNNFLDIGGGANAEKVRNSLDMILTDPAVQGVFINIFGGITRCDEVARGVITARDELKLKLPLVVRMTGTNEEEGRRILEDAGIVPGVSAPDAAKKIVELVGKN